MGWGFIGIIRSWMMTSSGPLMRRCRAVAPRCASSVAAIIVAPTRTPTVSTIPSHHPSAQIPSIHQRRQQPHEVHNRARAMQRPKLLIQPLHLLTLLPLLIVFLPIPRLLMLPRAHHPRRLRTQVHQIHQPTHKHRSQRNQYTQSVVGVQCAREARGERADGGAFRGEGQGKEEGGEGLKREVVRELGLLESRELGAWEGFVGDQAGDQGAPD
jgi:hypothetical protein